MIDLIYKAFCWILYTIMKWLLSLVGFIEKFFNIFAGTEEILYQGRSNYLINLFFAHDAVTNAFWAMALIAIALSFGFCIVSVARKVTDISGTTKQTVGQIVSNFVRSLIIILLLNLATVASINVANVLLDRINYSLINAENLNKGDREKEFTEGEFAAMARILSTIANYNVNSTQNNRYNVNACFNEVRGEMLSLYETGFFDFDYQMYDGHHTWQSALALLAKSADLTQDLQLNVYKPEVANAIETICDELTYNPAFKPVEKAYMVLDVNTESIRTDVMIFLVASMGAELNELFKNGSFDDALRLDYLNGNKDYMDLDVVEEDFDITEISYLVAIVSGFIFLNIMLTCIFMFIVRIFNLVMLYIVSPLFVSPMALDDGAKFQNWLQSFVIQLFSGFGSVIVMRIYLMVVPLIVSSDLVFFPDSGEGVLSLNYYARLLMILGGGWAVLRGSGVITGILSGQPGMAALNMEQEARGMAMAGMMKMPGLAKSVLDAPRKIATAPGKAYHAAKDYLRSFGDAYTDRTGRHREQTDAMTSLARAATRVAGEKGTATKDTSTKEKNSSNNTEGQTTTNINSPRNRNQTQNTDIKKQPEKKPDDQSSNEKKNGNRGAKTTDNLQSKHPTLESPEEASQKDSKTTDSYSPKNRIRLD